MQFVQFLRENQATPVAMMYLTNMKDLEVLQALIANADAAVALKQKKAKTVKLNRATINVILVAMKAFGPSDEADFNKSVEAMKLVELEINNCKDDACVSDLIDRNSIMTCETFR